MKKRLQSIHVRLRPERIRFINELANELGENFSDVLRNLIDIAVLVLNVVGLCKSLAITSWTTR
jgi:hypothetical protein